MQLERQLAATDLAARRHLQLVADDLQVGVEAPEQAAQEGEIALVELGPGGDRRVQPLHGGTQAELARHRAHHVGRAPVGEQPGAAGHARASQRVLGEHDQFGGAALHELGLQPADHAAEELARLGLVAGMDADRGTEGEPAAVLEGGLGTAVDGARPVGEAQLGGTHAALGFRDAHLDEQLGYARVGLSGQAQRGACAIDGGAADGGLGAHRRAPSRPASVGGALRAPSARDAAAR